MMGEIEVARRVERHQMDMRMRHINAYHSHSNLHAWTDLLQPPSHTAAEEMQIDKQLVIKVENIIHLFLGNTEHVAFNDRINIEKRQKILGLGDLVARNLPCHDT